MKWFFTLGFSCIAWLGNAQIGINTSDPNDYAALDIVATDKGLLIPRVGTATWENFADPPFGLLLVDTSLRCLMFYNGSDWNKICGVTTHETPSTNFGICGDSILIDIRDSQQYRIVAIGSQCWFAENLNIGTRLTGLGNPTDNSVIEKYCFIDSITHCDACGGLYTWDELMQYDTIEGARGICPPGWHVPSRDEYQVLMDTLTSLSMTTGGTLKENGTAHWQVPNTGATDSFNFTALPGGYRFVDGSTNGGNGFSGWGSNTSFWTSSQKTSTEAWFRTLLYNDDKSGVWSADKRYGRSCRCIKDEP